MMCLRDRSSTARLAAIVIMVVMPAFVVIIGRMTLLEAIAVVVVVIIVAETPAAMMASILLELAIVVVGRTREGRRSGRRIALVGGRRIRTRPLGRRVWLRGITSTHWSVGISRRTIVKTHADGRAHRLSLGRAVVSSSTSRGAELLLMLTGWVRLGMRGYRRAPLLRRTTWLLWGWVWLAVGRLLGRSTIRRLLLRAVGGLLLV